MEVIVGLEFIMDLMAMELKMNVSKTLYVIRALLGGIVINPAEVMVQALAWKEMRNLALVHIPAMGVLIAMGAFLMNLNVKSLVVSVNPL
tara:strand:- start:1232 stop:1501 length:270 start_codon:yes stop_codon:yes gene_type:complete